jgi:hypothetical protein
MERQSAMGGDQFILVELPATRHPLTVALAAIS